ncbi:hypothetical protein AHMF7605_28365 [Adhaeribacter arboris]|uniref:Lipocalin-like domain-containing protein n=1 Tax=Adhaeribacter arboris TaxID=2072846 RepID=A0A2T2YNN1_9BACT|nr:hypothetical protein [Adhaeribacter arboris]PSR57115.1 hypothetical protein AHMF7605_28365 [Adhaeribacter arboris]
MKRLLYFCLFCFIVFGCKKDEEKPKSFNDLLQGTWNVSSDKTEYYDTANVKVYEKTTTNNFKYIIQDKNIITNNGGTIAQYATYSLSEQNGKKFINLIAPGFNTIFEVTTLTDKNMTWQLESLNVLYFEGGSQKTAAKSIFTIQLEK